MKKNPSFGALRLIHRIVIFFFGAGFFCVFVSIQQHYIGTIDGWRGYIFLALSGGICALILAKSHAMRQRDVLSSQKKNESYRTLVQNMPVLVCRFLPDGTVTFANEAYCQYFTLSDTNLRQTNFFQHIPESEREKRRRHLQSLTPLASVKHYAHRVMTPNGESHWLRWVDRAIFDQENRLIAYQSVSDVVTGYTYGLNTLKEDEKKWSVFYDDLPGGSYTVNDRYIIEDVNDVLCQVTGYTKEELIGQSCGIICPKGPHTCPIFDLGQEHIDNNETSVKAKDGHLVPIIKSAKRISLGRREVIIENFQDTTDLKRVEKIRASLYQISEAAHSSRNLEELFASIHRIIGRLMPARNFYIALNDPDTGMFSFPYFVDEFDDIPATPPKMTKGLIEYVIRTKQPLFVSPKKLHELIEQGEIDSIRETQAVDWLGVPLHVSGKTIGALAVQNYTKGARYGDEGKDILTFVSNQIAMAIERVRTEDALRQSEARMRLLVQHLPVMVKARDKDGHIIMWNHECERVTGYSADEMINVHKLFDLFFPDDSSRQQESSKLNEAQGDFQNFEVAMTCKNGIEKVVSWSNVSKYYPIPGWAGWAVGIDVTERKEAEKALAEERNLLRALIDHLPDYLYLKDKQSRFLIANSAVLHGMGVSSLDELIGRTDFDFYPHNLAKQYYNDERRVINLGQPLIEREEAVINHETGANEWLLTTKIPYRDTQGKILGLVGISHDITDRKRAQEFLEQHNRELQLLNHMSELFQTCQKEEDTYKIIMNMCEQLFPEDSGCLYLMEQTQSMLKPIVFWGEESFQTTECYPDECWALYSGKIHTFEHLETELCCSHVHLTPGKGYLCAPIVATGEKLGLITLCFKRDDAKHSDGQYHHKLTSKRMLVPRVAEHYALSLTNLRLREKLRADSIRDSLTGLYNRRYMEAALEQQTFRCKRYNSPLGIIMLDVDYFKEFNDRYGHDAGDVVLRELGCFLKTHIRGGDIACRYGGEEFLLIMPGASLKIAEQRARELHDNINELKIPYHRKTFSISMSIGVAAFPNHGSNLMDIVKIADTALYSAKNEGRNRVVIAPLTPPPEECHEGEQ